MNISLAKNDLISALQIVSKGLSTKPQTPILSGIYMTAKEGQLELQTTNYELGFILTIPAEIHNTGTAVLPGKYLTEFAQAAGRGSLHRYGFCRRPCRHPIRRCPLHPADNGDQ